MTVDELIFESVTTRDHSWFVQAVKIVEQTDTKVTLHFTIGPELFVQIFFSQRGGRLNLALVDTPLLPKPAPK